MMSERRDRPYTGANFLVSIGEGDGRAPADGFAEVIFPPFVTDRTREPGTVPDDLASRVLVLRRGVTGSLDLYKWWDEARRAPERATRTVTVQLLGEGHTGVVLTWRFLRAYPVSVSYSPLRAMDAGGILMESIELAFDTVEMS
jgi:hypothetical protein